MTSERLPPELDGLTYLEAIGAGGFADVYLYQQSLPSRRVAVKVLREGTDDAGLEMFYAEANVMAQLSGHPSIVPIFQANVSAEGLAYLVMEYCPPPHLADRFRVERIAVPEILEVAVKIASAVETAHRAGVMHRDIKPHNILSSAYGAPLLTDFGIASVADGSGPSYGMSIPWSPPEAFDEESGPDVRSDVYSLAATVYSLLAGRSPFEVPGAANDNATLIHRIENQNPSAIARADVPEPLQQLLLRSMSKRMDDRPPSAMAFARSIQEVQIGLQLSPTRLEVMDATPESSGGVAVIDDARTKVKPISIIIPDALVERGTLIRPRSIAQVSDKTGVRPRRIEPKPDSAPVGALPPAGVEMLGPPSPQMEGEPPAPPSRSSRSRRVLGALALAVLGAVVLIALVTGGDGPPEPTGDASPSTPPDELILGGPAKPTDLSVRRKGGQVVVHWVNPDSQPGDTYRVEVGESLSRLTEVARESKTSFDMAADPGSQVCVAITVVRDGAASPSLEDCVVAP